MAVGLTQLTHSPLDAPPLDFLEAASVTGPAVQSSAVKDRSATFNPALLPSELEEAIVLAARQRASPRFCFEMAQLIGERSDTSRKRERRKLSRRSRC